MKQIALMLIPLILLSLCACSAEQVPAMTGAPFCENACWDWDTERVTEEYGECAAPYASVYGGITLSYPLAWQEREGTVKFMFSEDGRLASVAWTLITESAEVLDEVYDTIIGLEAEKNGTDGSLSQGVGNYGALWYLEDRDVLVTAVSVGGSCGLQYSYIGLDFSGRDRVQPDPQ